MKLGHQRKSHHKGLVGAFNQEKALVGAYSAVIAKTNFETDGSSAALVTSPHRRGCLVCAAGELPQRDNPRGALPGLDTI